MSTVRFYRTVNFIGGLLLEWLFPLSFYVILCMDI